MSSPRTPAVVPGVRRWTWILPSLLLVVALPCLQLDCGYSKRLQPYDAIILGAGAAGLMCAAEAVKRGRRVAVLEHNAEPGRKILISGGGRCNFTNRDCRPENFI